MKSRFVFRTRLVAGAVLLVAAVIAGRLYFLQVVHGAALAEEAERSYVRPSGGSFDRGSIFFSDRGGRLVSAATLKTGFTLAISPRELANPEAAYEKLSALIPLDREKFLARAKKLDDPYEEIARRVEEPVGEAIAALAIPGVKLVRERWRYYPGGSLAAQTVGFVGYDGDRLAGRYGIERFYEDVLARDGAGAYVNFFAEIFANVRATFSDAGRLPGDIVTTIEPSVELELEKALGKIAAAHAPRLSGGIVMNPKTGAIYAMAALPSFDLNAFQGVSDPRVFRNPLVEDVYEFGSIVKPITMAIGLDTGVVATETTYVDNGFIVLDQAKISNFDGKGRGRVSMQEVLNQSLNTGAAFVAGRVGKERFAAYLRDFGFGGFSGIDLPNEAEHLVQNLSSPRLVEYATASFGQGVALTPVSMARALAALGNGGVLVTPHVAREIRYASGLTRSLTPPPGRRVIAEETSEKITRMLVEVVDTALRGGTAKVPAYSIAAKTGTAQIAKAGERGYYEDRFLHSFFGYAPAYDPDFLVFLYAVEPSNARFASETLTLPFMDLMRFLINYYEIPPDR